MKILNYEPKSYATPFLDESRLGFHVKSIQREDLSHLEKGIILLGCADDTGIRNVGGRLGAAQGPNFLRQKLYRFTTGIPLKPIYDLGDILPATKIESTHETVRELCQEVWAQGHEPIVVGGGHDFGFPHALACLQNFPSKSISILNVDAHLDLRPAIPKVSSGSPWYLLREHSAFSSKKHKILEFGIQGHCNADTLYSYAKQKGISICSLKEIQKEKSGALKALEKFLKKQNAKSLLLSLDIDSVCWADAPGCSAPQVEGFPAQDILEICHQLGKSKSCLGMGLFELSPLLDTDGRTSTLAAHCIRTYLTGRGYLSTR